MEKAIELKPCPFCGKQPELGSLGGDKTNWAIWCQCNIACAETGLHGDTKEQIINAWNKRALLPPVCKTCGGSKKQCNRIGGCLIKQGKDSCCCLYDSCDMGKCPPCPVCKQKPEASEFARTIRQDLLNTGLYWSQEKMKRRLEEACDRLDDAKQEVADVKDEYRRYRERWDDVKFRQLETQIKEQYDKGFLEGSEAQESANREHIIGPLEAANKAKDEAIDKLKHAIEEAKVKRGQYREIIEALLVPTNFIGIEAARDYICEALESYGLATIKPATKEPE